MGEKITAGFHTCVDYELAWDPGVLKKAICDFDIRSAELVPGIRPDSERNVWRMTLYYMKEGVGAEILPEKPEIVDRFADRFQYRITIGGTAARACISLSKIGISSMLSMSSYNEVIERELPPLVRRFSNTGKEYGPIYPHACFTYLSGQRIQANDIDFITKRENRILVSCDIESMNLAVSQDFAPYLKDAEVFLLSCFSQMVEEKKLKERVAQTGELLRSLPEKAVCVMEDGNYPNPSFRRYVHTHLCGAVDVLSMNEDEFQEYAGEKINILDPESVGSVLEEVYNQAGFPTLIVHSSQWALAFGRGAEHFRQALLRAILLAGTRFRKGDELNREDYLNTAQFSDSKEGAAFCTGIEKMFGNRIAAVPGKDLRCISHPTVVGLGDTFAGGLLPGLLVRNRAGLND